MRHLVLYTTRRRRISCGAAISLVLALLGATAAAARPPETAESEAHSARLIEERAALDERLRQLQEKIRTLEIERDEIVLAYRVLSDELNRIASERSILSIENDGRTAEAGEHRELAALETRAAELSRHLSEVRIDHQRDLKDPTAERQRVQAELRAISRSPEFRTLDDEARYSQTVELHRRDFELDLEIGTRSREWTRRHLDLQRQMRTVQIQRYRQLREMAERTGNDQRAETLVHSISRITRDAARSETAEVLEVLKWELRRETLELRLAELDAWFLPETREPITRRLDEVRQGLLDLRALQSSHGRRTGLEKLERDLERDIERLETQRSGATERDAELFERELEKLRNAVRKLAETV